MEGKLTPRQIVKGLLSGIQPQRPLLLPLVFAIGARIENVPRSGYLHNPTKIVSALRQVWNHLQVDGIACYIDPYLEVEALGANLEYQSHDGPPKIHWQRSARPSEIPEGLRLPEDAARNGRIPVAAEVIRRMNAVPNRDFLLMATVAGPMSLATKITQTGVNACVIQKELPVEALELASSMSTQTATAFLEARADVIVIQEEMSANLSSAELQEWKNRVAPAINVARFYEALPVVQVRGGPSVSFCWDKTQTQGWDGLLCLTPPAALARSVRESGDKSRLPVGLSLPLGTLETERANSEEALGTMLEMIAELRPCVVTTEDDVPLTTDLQYLKRVLGEIGRPS